MATTKKALKVNIIASAIVLLVMPVRHSTLLFVVTAVILTCYAYAVSLTTQHW